MFVFLSLGWSVFSYNLRNIPNRNKTWWPWHFPLFYSYRTHFPYFIYFRCYWINVHSEPRDIEDVRIFILKDIKKNPKVSLHLGWLLNKCVLCVRVPHVRDLGEAENVALVQRQSELKHQGPSGLSDVRHRLPIAYVCHLGYASSERGPPLNAAEKTWPLDRARRCVILKVLR